MFSHHWMHAPVMAGRRGACSIRHLGRVAALVAAAGLAACAGTSVTPIVGAHPADPNAPVRAATYRSVTGGASIARPSEPSAWTDSNERVTPGEKP